MLVAAVVFAMGRSPRVRGRRERDVFTRLDVGSIPACAGETAVLPVLTVYSEVDPRVCGGDAMAIRLAPANGGRSPRVRGRR